MIPTNPLIVKGVLYGLDGHKNLFALNAATGDELWVYPFNRSATAKGAGRGLVYWEGKLSNGVTAEYILVGHEHLLYAIDAVSGNLVQDFGRDGTVDLRLGLDRKPQSTNVAANTPGTLFKDLLIMGFATSEDYSASPGYIRAYHMPSGQLRWTFKTIPGAGEYGVDTWPEANRDKRGGAKSNTELNMAQFVRLGLHHDLTDLFAISFTLGWDDWSAMEDVFVSLPEIGAGLERNWEDTYHYAAGFEYTINSDWDITAGIAYDTNPVDARDRTADMPIDRQIRYTGGARYQFRENITLGGYLNYSDLGSAKIRTERWGGEYAKNEVIEFAFYVNWLI